MSNSKTWSRILVDDTAIHEKLCAMAGGDESLVSRMKDPTDSLYTYSKVLHDLLEDVPSDYHLLTTGFPFIFEKENV